MQATTVRVSRSVIPLIALESLNNIDNYPDVDELAAGKVGLHLFSVLVGRGVRTQPD